MPKKTSSKRTTKKSAPVEDFLTKVAESPVAEVVEKTIATATAPLNPKKKNNAKTIWLVLAVLLIIGTGLLIFYYSSSQPSQIGNGTTEDEIRIITSNISKYMDLPQNDVPTLATILDKEKLEGQQFFKNAQNGDKLLVYNQTKVAILYRPSTNRIINVGPVVNATSTETTASPQIAYYNGTTIPGLAGQSEKKVRAAFTQAKTASIGNAANKNYTKTLIIDLTGNNSAFVAELATLLGGEVGTLPEAETAPEADILVITGQ